MKIIAGSLKGRKLCSIKGFRPTTSLIKKAVFDICKDKIEDSIFLDLFAGSGAIGIEAISRKAKFVFFIEKEKKNYFLIKKNIFSLQLQKSSKVILSDSLFALKKIGKRAFDIIYIDPPYIVDKEYLFEILKVIEKKRLLKKDGILFIEAFKKRKKELKEITSLFFSNIKINKYGSSILMICNF